jgi:hypothetical protein
VIAIQNLFEHVSGLRVVLMIADVKETFSARRVALVGCVLERARQVRFYRLALDLRSPGDVDRGAARTQPQCDSSSDAPTRTGDHRYSPIQIERHLSRLAEIHGGRVAAA